MNLVSLRPSHTKALVFSHPLLDDAPVYSEEELDFMAYASKLHPNSEELREQLTMALRSCLRNLVGRYLYNWPVSRRFEDDMVSEGFSVICEFVLDLPSEWGILKIVSRRIQDRINVFLNDNQSAAAPSLRQQKYLKRDGKDPIYTNATGELPEEAEPEETGDEWIRDFLDALNQIQPKDKIDAALLDSFKWGMKYQELADELGVGVGTIHRRRRRLYAQFLQLTR